MSRYLHYHSDDLNASDALVEEKDLQLYIRAIQLARGEDVEGILQSEYETSRNSQGGTYEAALRDLDEGGGERSNDNNAAFYENYLKPIDV